MFPRSRPCNYLHKFDHIASLSTYDYPPCMQASTRDEESRLNFWRHTWLSASRGSLPVPMSLQLLTLTAPQQQAKH